MKATHHFFCKGIKGFIFADGTIVWDTITAHIDSIRGGLRTRAIFAAKEIR